MAIPSLDIFRRDVHGSPVWIDSVEDLRTARIRLSQLVSELPAEYFVFDQGTNRTVGKVLSVRFGRQVIKRFASPPVGRGLRPIARGGGAGAGGGAPAPRFRKTKIALGYFF